MQYYKKTNPEFAGEQLNNKFTIQDVKKLLGCNEDDANAYINNWINEGYITVYVDTKNK